MDDFKGKVRKLTVRYHDRIVGTLALYKNDRIAFEYHPEWINEGFSISPFSLPLEKRLFIPEIEPFDGLFGVFADSLPDGWGRLLVDRVLMKHGILSNTLTSLDRLALVGSSGMGALTYHPHVAIEPFKNFVDLDNLASECSKLLETDYSNDLEHLFSLGGSSGGTRPKILTQYDKADWIIKFPSCHDKATIGEEEYKYSKCAQECGIEMSETKLFQTIHSRGYFGTRRFDRIQTTEGETIKKHMISASGLLEITRRIPNLDYNVLMKLTLELTKDFTEVEKMYRLMCFNVYAHNGDDHAKNFSYLYNEVEARWQLAPAYDLTFSFSFDREHATSINGNGKSPSLEDMLAVGKGIGMKELSCRKITLEIREIVKKYGILHYS